MNKIYIKIKYKPTLIKWAVTIFFLAFNLMLLTLDEKSGFPEDLTTIYIVLVADALAILSFVLLSFFPRFYFVFDEKGCSFQNKKQKKYLEICRQDIIKISFGRVLEPEMEIQWRDNEQQKTVKTEFIMPRKSFLEIYNAIPWVKEFVDISEKDFEK